MIWYQCRSYLDCDPRVIGNAVLLDMKFNDIILFEKMNLRRKKSTNIDYIKDLAETEKSASDVSQ